MTMVEKMAFAMEAAAMTTGTKDFTDSRSLTIKMAVAALKAMRDPTDVMTAVGDDALLDEMKDTFMGPAPVPIYRAFIDAAISEHVATAIGNRRA